MKSEKLNGNEYIYLKWQLILLSNKATVWQKVKMKWYLFKKCVSRFYDCQGFGSFSSVLIWL